jgi:CheY-like chemotaxis protein
VSKIVLVVDDSVTMQQVADITFRGTEFTYVGARSYEEAVEKAKAQKPTVVLADSVMPGKNGYDLALSLKSDASTANIPVVILVGNGAPYDSSKGVEVGADANLPKPWDSQTMLEKVTEIVVKAATGVAKPGHGVAVTPSPSAAPIVAAAAAAPKVPAVSPGVPPPRSATIMGMPTIKMPAGNAPAASKTTVMAVPPVAPEQRAPATQLRAPAAPAPAAAAVVASTPSEPLSFNPSFGAHRPPMVAGHLTKRSALVEATLAKMAARLSEATGLQPGSPELIALLKLSAEVVEKVVWEVVPDLAEQIIRENLQQLTAPARKA